MSDGLLIAIVGVIGTVLTALFAYLATQQAKATQRQASLEKRIRSLETRDRRSWLYIRSLIDYAYRHTDTVMFPLPEPPEGWLDDPQEKE